MLDLPARHPNFVGRTAALERLEKAFARMNLLALEGRAGSGKTSLALELANRRHDQAPEQPLLWIRARGGWSVESLLLELSRHWSAAAGSPAAQAPRELPLEERLMLWARELSGRDATLVIDDFHHLDNGLLLLRTFREYLRKGRLLLTTRRALELDPLARVDSAILRLSGLSDEEGRALLSQLLEQQHLAEWQAPHRFDALLRAGRGLPLLLKLLVSLLMQNPLTSLEDIAGMQGKLYKDLVGELEASLPQAERETLRALAIFRRPVPARALAEEADHHLPALADRLLIERGPGDTWTTHDVFGDVFEHSLEEGESQRLHARCARYYEGLESEPLLARESIHHLWLSAQPERARQVLLENATLLYQAAQYDYLLALTSQMAGGDEPDATSLVILRAEALAMVGQTEASMKLFLEAESKGDLQQRIRAMNSRCHLVLENGELEQAQAIAGRALALLETTTGRRPGRVKALNAMALAQARRGHRDSALETARRSLEISAEIGDPKGACYAHYAQALAYRHAGDWPDGLLAAELSQAAAESAGETRLWFLAGLVKSLALLELERWEAAHEVARDHWQRSLGYPDPLSGAMAALGYGAFLQSQGRLAEAIECLEGALKLGEQHRGRVFLAQLHLSLGTAYQQANQVAQARDQFESGLALAGKVDAFPLEAELELRLSLLDGQPQVTEARFERATRLGLAGLAARLRLGLAATERARGQDRAARECLIGINMGALDQQERDFHAFLRTLLDGGRPQPPSGAWEGAANALLGGEMKPFKVSTWVGSAQPSTDFAQGTGDGRRAASLAEVQSLSQSAGSFDLFIDLPGQIAVERQRGSLTLLRRKVLVRLLIALLRAAGKEPLTQEELYECVWGPPYDPESGGPQVRKNVSALRDLLEPDRQAPRYLLVREGAFARKGGYMWSPEHSFCLIEES